MLLCWASSVVRSRIVRAAAKPLKAGTRPVCVRTGKTGSHSPSPGRVYLVNFARGEGEGRGPVFLFLAFLFVPLAWVTPISVLIQLF